MIHNDPPSASDTPLQSNLITLIARSDSRIKKKTNHLWLKSNKGPINGAEVLKRVTSKKRKNRDSIEDDFLQPAFARRMDEVQAQLGEDNLLWTHIGHGGRKHIGVAMMHKRAGLKKGILDNQIYCARNGKPLGLFIEVKLKGNYLSDEQKHFIKVMTAFGFVCEVIYAEHPVDVVQKLNVILRENGVVS